MKLSVQEKCVRVSTVLQWFLIAGLAAWCAHLQTSTDAASGPVVQERLKTLEASSLITQQSLQINCNGNDSFTILNSNGFAQARFCLLPNPENVTLPETFVNATIYGNTTELDVMNDTYFVFEGVTNMWDRTPTFFISTRFDRLCGYYATQPYPDDFVWCVPLRNLVCGRSNLVQAQFETAPLRTVVLDVELGFSIEACAIFNPV